MPGQPTQGVQACSRNVSKRRRSRLRDWLTTKGWGDGSDIFEIERFVALNICGLG